MRSSLVAALAVVILSLGPNASARDRLADHPWSVGLHLGVMTLDSLAVFAMEIPVEYTFELGPGELAPHLGFLLTARKGYTGIGFPIGVRYKLRLLDKYPLYAWPMLDIGPVFVTQTGTAGGILRVGGGMSYLVHPMVELLIQPLGLGTTFNSGGAVFMYNLLLGANIRF